MFYFRITFKRKHKKRRSRFSLSNLFFNEAPESSPGTTHYGRNGQPPEHTPSMAHGQTSTGRNLNMQKEGGPMDWYVEGPGRRVGYDDLTAIDWIFEYTKERQRKRLLYSSGQGIIGNIRKLLDAGNVWLVLIATGVAVGIIAAFIDVASDWLADLKTGFCKNGEGGGKFYLNRSFCCWGHDGEFISSPNTMLLPIMLMKSIDRFVQMFGLDSMGEGFGSQLQRRRFYG